MKTEIFARGRYGNNVLLPACQNEVTGLWRYNSWPRRSKTRCPVLRNPNENPATGFWNNKPSTAFYMLVYRDTLEPVKGFAATLRKEEATLSMWRAVNAGCRNIEIVKVGK